MEVAYRVPKIDRKGTFSCYNNIQKIEESEKPQFEVKNISEFDEDFDYEYWEDRVNLLEKEEIFQRRRIMPKDLTVPTFLLCPLSKQLMNQPVLIESGYTFNKDAIQAFFQSKQKLRDEDQKEIDSSSFDESEYFRCPISFKKVNYMNMIENTRIKKAVQEFL